MYKIMYRIDYIKEDEDSFIYEDEEEWSLDLSRDEPEEKDEEEPFLIQLEEESEDDWTLDLSKEDPPVKEEEEPDPLAPMVIEFYDQIL